MIVHRTIWILACALMSRALFADCLPKTMSHDGFVEHLTPIIAHENQRISEQRTALIKLQKQWQKSQYLSIYQRFKLTSWAKDYHMASFEPKDPDAWQILKKRMDTVPPRLILAQAILESGYGQSRFARQGCNLFGQQCFEKGCGLVPKQRPRGKTHEVKRFASIAQSIRAYIQNLNTHPAYSTFRQKRAHLRHLHQHPDPLILAETLNPYAQIGQAYGQRLSKLIQKLHKD